MGSLRGQAFVPRYIEEDWDLFQMKLKNAATGSADQREADLFPCSLFPLKPLTPFYDHPSISQIELSFMAITTSQDRPQHMVFVSPSKLSERATITI
jgi:hypothetical protein